MAKKSKQVGLPLNHIKITCDVDLNLPVYETKFAWLPKKISGTWVWFNNYITRKNKTLKIGHIDQKRGNKK